MHTDSLNFIFTKDHHIAQDAKQNIYNLAFEKGIFPASIAPILKARADKTISPTFTVPAFNLRGLTYLSAKAILEAAIHLNAGPLIFEIARSESLYTHQSPQQYVAQVLAAAIDVGWQGALFFQADHMQPKASKVAHPKDGEIEILKKVIDHYILAGAYNIDIDTSTLVNSNASSVEERQEPNIVYSVDIMKHTLSTMPTGIIPGIGGEIGHIGGTNSTLEEAKVFINGVEKELGYVPFTKIAIQNGTSHGGSINKDGTLAPVSIDFDLHGQIGEYVLSKGLGGTVQHGASTISDNYYSKFPQYFVTEIHLATGIQNLILDHPSFPSSIKEHMYRWMDQNLSDERKEDWNDIQFHYKLRKKAWGAFQEELMSLNPDDLEPIFIDMQKRAEFFIKSFKLTDSRELLNLIDTPSEPVELPVDSYISDTLSDVTGLSD